MLPIPKSLGKTVDSFRRNEDKRNQDRREDQPPVLDHCAELIRKNNEGCSTPQRTQEVMNSSEDAHQYSVGGMLPIEVVCIRPLQKIGEQTTGVSNQASRNDKGHQLYSINVITESGDALLVVTNRLERPPKRRMRDPPKQVQADYDRDDHEGMKRNGRRKPGTLHSLESILASG